MITAVWLFPVAATAVEPVISSVEPTRIAGRAPFTLTVTGEGFTSTTKVRLSGLARSVVEWSPSRLVVSGELASDTAGLCSITAVNGQDASNPKFRPRQSLRIPSWANRLAQTLCGNVQYRHAGAPDYARRNRGVHRRQWQQLVPSAELVFAQRSSDPVANVRSTRRWTWLERRYD